MSAARANKNFFDKIKGVSRDLIDSMLGLIAMNGVIQFVLYPGFQRYMGTESFGRVLTLLSIVAIMGCTFGVAANYSRMLVKTKKIECKGDYNIFLLCIGILCIPVSIAGLAWLGDGSVWMLIGFVLLMVMTVLRYYSDVEFRLNVNYRGFLLFYILISVGYVVGLLLYPITHSWIVAMLIGEAAAVLFVFFKGTLYEKPYFAKSQYFKDNMKSVIILSLTEFIASVILNADRLMLQAIVGGVAVTIFYVATLVGKMVSLVSVPLNGVIMGHLAKYEGKLSGNTFLKLCVGVILLGAVLNVLCVGVSIVFVMLLYPDLYSDVKPYLMVTNAGQIYYFLSNTLTVVLLRFTDEKYQLYINIVYMIVFVLLAVPMTFLWHIWGMAWALIIVNLIKIVAIMVVGKLKL
jgi:O-antigen/teichoic acid export membrane protein